MGRIGAALTACALTFLVDAAIFRTRLYLAVLEPQSYAGQADLVMRTASAAANGLDGLVLGDSRIGEGFSAGIANDSTAGRLRFINAAIGASTPRCWYYVLREIDPDASHYRAIILPLDDYEDEDGPWDWADRVLDELIVVNALHVTDIPPFVESFQGTRERYQALRGALLKGFTLKNDVQSFLSHPLQRLEKVRVWREHGAQWNYDYNGNPKTLRGLLVDWSRRAIEFPADL